MTAAGCDRETRYFYYYSTIRVLVLVLSLMAVTLYGVGSTVRKFRQIWPSSATEKNTEFKTMVSLCKKSVTA